jgi:hypothetical protein
MEIYDEEEVVLIMVALYILLLVVSVIFRVTLSPAVPAVVVLIVTGDPAEIDCDVSELFCGPEPKARTTVDPANVADPLTGPTFHTPLPV